MYDDSYFQEPIQTLLDEIAELNEDNVLTFIDKRLPGWLLSCNLNYSKECALFEDNWRNKMCKLFKVEPQSILIVSKIVLPYGVDYKNHIVLMRYCDVLTKFGYCVRSIEVFKECKKCKKIRQTKSTNHICNF